MGQRAAGVLIPLFSTRVGDDLGRGDILNLAPMIDFARDAGLSIIQLLPLDETAPDENSPYSAMSVLAIDPIYIAMRGVPNIGRISLARARSRVGRGRGVSRGVLRPVVLPLLERAFRSARRGRKLESDEGFAKFQDLNRDWLPEYALFRALKERFSWESWEEWPRDLAHHEPAAVETARRELAQPIAMYSWWQYLAATQWNAMRSYAHDRGVWLAGDIAFSPARESAEVWANQEMFDLTRTVGAPPDAFNQKGQRWGLPLPNWEAMRAGNFKLWETRARRAGAMFDLIRIDHVVGLYRTFSFGNDSDAEGHFSPQDRDDQIEQGERMMRALSAAAAPCAFVAEDLGSVPEWVRESLTRMNVPGYKVMRWERIGWDTPHERFVAPSAYPELSVATTGTHDTETVAEWWRELDAASREKFCSALHICDRMRPDCPRLHESSLDAIVETLYAAPSRYVILPVQDFFGWTARINRPGTINESNWTYRLPLTIERLRQNPWVAARIIKLRELARKCGRTPAA